MSRKILMAPDAWSLYEDEICVGRFPATQIKELLLRLEASPDTIRSFDYWWGEASDYGRALFFATLLKWLGPAGEMELRLPGKTGTFTTKEVVADPTIASDLARLPTHLPDLRGWWNEVP
jgi:hypothetical protein